MACELEGMDYYVEVKNVLKVGNGKITTANIRGLKTEIHNKNLDEVNRLKNVVDEYLNDINGINVASDVIAMSAFLIGVATSKLVDNNYVLYLILFGILFGFLIFAFRYTSVKSSKKKNLIALKIAIEEREQELRKNSIKKFRFSRAK